MERLLIKIDVIKKILENESDFENKEFGGYLIIENNIISDLIIDVKFSDFGYVLLGVNKLLKHETKFGFIKGWFHKHPINGYSSMDKNTMIDLTNFWGECYSLILQQNRKLLYIYTILNEKRQFEIKKSFEIDLNNFVK